MNDHDNCVVSTMLLAKVTVPLFPSILSYRLKEELEALVKDKCQKYNSVLGALQFKFHVPPAHTSTVAWVGGKNFQHCVYLQVKALPFSVFQTFFIL